MSSKWKLEMIVSSQSKVTYFFHQEEKNIISSMAEELQHTTEIKIKEDS